MWKKSLVKFHKLCLCWKLQDRLPVACGGEEEWEAVKKYNGEWCGGGFAFGTVYFFLFLKMCKRQYESGNNNIQRTNCWGCGGLVFVTLTEVLQAVRSWCYSLLHFLWLYIILQDKSFCCGPSNPWLQTCAANFVLSPRMPNIWTRENSGAVLCSCGI